MASSSSSSVQQKYDVFLNFRAEDTRSNFTSHLYATLKRKGIDPFFDYELPREEEISPTLLKAIEESKISIIILSKNYAFSSWCLEELCKILECKERNGQKVVPIFYYVNPFDVRKQTGSFAEAFAKHEERFKDRADKVRRWSAALREVGNLSGWHLQNDFDRLESEYIEDIVKYICTSLNKGFFSMASSSSSSVQQKYDVFLSFRGEDTRQSFTSHLHAALKRKGIEIFIDYQLERGEEISPEFLTAIEESKISIIVLSKNYASSSWCLDEHCKILECKKRNGQMVVPIFYRVNPSNVRKQKRSFGEAFAKNQERFKDRTDKVDRWRAALAEVGNLSGYFVRKDMLESELIEDIVKSIHSNLNREFFSMASSSSSSLQQKYEIFISFRGEDTRQSFTSHLHAALKRKGIKIFIDYQLERGEEISSELLTAIEESKISIIVLSKNYASSSWCLDELCKILECKKRNGQMVVLIFYHVNPSDVRKQKRSFGEAFAKHQERFKDRTDKADRWRAALAEVGNLSGYLVQKDMLESELIEDIVRFNCANLNRELSNLVGMDSRIEELEKLLDHMESDGVVTLGIWGMPGVGKTTTAEALFNRISGGFDASYFLADVREKSIRQGLECERNELFFEILKENLKIDTPSIKGTFIKHKLHRRNVLIVLNDVDYSQQVEYLIGDRSCFGPGSRIIITSKNEGVLRSIADIIYEVKKLTYVQALELFFQFAFRGKQYRETYMIEYMRLSDRVVCYADGIPLALKVLGNFLYDKEEATWDSELSRLEEENGPMVETDEVLTISYDGLDDDEKQIFLDVACFFEGEDKNRVRDILDGCGFLTDIGIAVLSSKSLITIVNNNLQMHILIQEMGRKIVRQESKHPGERSRLWIYDDILDVLTTDKGTKMVEGIFLNMSEIEKPICINPEAFLRMCNLRLLKIYSPHSQEDCKVHLPVGFQIRSNKLAYLHWHCYPLESLPLNFDPKNLVELHMHYSHIVQLWEGTQKLQKLKWIDLSYSQRLKEMPDLSKAPNLVQINLVCCTSLLEIPSTAAPLCYLQAVRLSGCSNFKNFPLLSWNIEELHLDETAIEEVPSEIHHFSRLVKLNMKNCKRLKNLPSIHRKLSSLEFLDLLGCSSLINFPEISWNLKELLLNETAIEELPSSIEFLGNLVSLKLQNCTRIKYLPSSICKLKSLEILDLSGCTRLQSVPELPPNLQYLDAHDCTSLEAKSSSFPIIHGWGQRFKFMNCTKLNQNTIGATTQLSIQQRATADVKLYHKDEKQDLKPRFSSICICFPESEIPEWFNCQNLGSSVTTLLPPHLHDHKFVGFALCVVVAFEHYNKDLGFTVECRCNFKIEGDDCHECLSYLSVWDKSDSPRFIGSDSDHVFISYDFNLYSDWYSKENKYHLKEASFEFSACDSYSGDPLDSCIFKKCGVCLLAKMFK